MEARKLDPPNENDYFELEVRFEDAKSLVRHAKQKVEVAEGHCVTFKLLYSQTELIGRVDWAKKVLERCKERLSRVRDMYYEAEQEFHNNL